MSTILGPDGMPANQPNWEQEFHNAFMDTFLQLVCKKRTNKQIRRHMEAKGYRVTDEEINRGRKDLKEFEAKKPALYAQFKARYRL